MSDSVRDVLVRGIAAAKARDKAEARFCLEWVLRMDASLDQRVDAWFWLSEVSDCPGEKRDLLENVLAASPGHAGARRALAILDGRLNPEEVVDPDRMQVSDSGAPRPAEAARFGCPTCGARMRYVPSSNALRCQYCGHRQALSNGAAGGAGEGEQDFVVALATLRGHATPTTARTFRCSSCGKSFVLSPQTLSLTCAYCGSTYAVREAETRELIPPSSLIPCTVTPEGAAKALVDWLEGASASATAPGTRVRGVYVPAWAFDFAGEVGWTAELPAVLGRQRVTESGTLPVLYHDVLAAASTLPVSRVDDLLKSYYLSALVPFDKRYLADWPAETYSISVSDASLAARGQALALARADVGEQLSGEAQGLSLNSVGLTIDSYRLVLLPLYVIQYSERSQPKVAVVNGQTGSVHGDPPRGSLWRRLRALPGS